MSAPTHASQTRKHLLTPAFIAFLLCMTLFGIGDGIFLPLAPLELQRMGLPPHIIGLNAALAAAVAVASTLLVPKLLSKIPSSYLIIGGATLSAVVFLSLNSLLNPIAWFIIRPLEGVSFGVAAAAAEFHVNANTPNRFRARAVSLLFFSYAAGAAAGPFLLALTKTSGWIPYIAAAAAVSLSALILLPFQKTDAKPIREPSSILKILLVIPFAASCALAGGALDGAAELLPLFAQQLSFSPQAASILLGVFLAGSLASLPLAGILADAVPRNLALITFLALGCVGAVLLPITPFPSAFILGGSAAGIAAISLAMCGDAVPYGAGLASASAAFTLCEAAGGAVSPTPAGFALLLPPLGLPALFLLILLPLLLIAVAASLRKTIH